MMHPFAFVTATPVPFCTHPLSTTSHLARPTPVRICSAHVTARRVCTIQCNVPDKRAERLADQSTPTSSSSSPSSSSSSLTSFLLSKLPFVQSTDSTSDRSMQSLLARSLHSLACVFLCANAGLAVLAFSFALSGGPEMAEATIPASIKLPPIDRTDASRCKPTSSAIGQANAARDKLLDLRECDLSGSDLSSYDLSGALLSNANLSGVRLIDSQLSKSYAPYSDFRGVDFTNAVVDRVVFDHSDLTGALFVNAVLSDATFDDAVLENVDFTDVYIGDFAQRSICKNPTTKGTNPVTGAGTRESLGCR